MIIKITILIFFLTCENILQARDYFVSPTGKNSNDGSAEHPLLTINLALSKAVPGDKVLLLPGIYKQKVQVELVGTKENPITIKASVTGKAILDGSSQTLEEDTGLFYILRSSNIIIDGIRLIKSSRAGFLAEKSTSIRIENCNTFDTFSSGIGIWNSSFIQLVSNKVELACNGGPQECITMAVSNDFLITGNTVCNGSPGDTGGGEGLDVKDGSHDGVVKGNTVYNLPKKLGFYVDAWDKHTYNIEIEGNRVYRCTDGIAVASEAGGLLENIRIVNNLVYDNIFRGFIVGDWGLENVNHPMKNISFINNTSYHNGDTWGYGIALDNPEAQQIVIRNNIIAQNYSGAMVYGEKVSRKNITVDHNLFFESVEEDRSLYGMNFIIADPLFTDLDRFDFRLKKGSPANAGGSSVNAPVLDFTGFKRPSGKDPDIGAYQNTW